MKAQSSAGVDCTIRDVFARPAFHGARGGIQLRQHREATGMAALRTTSLLLVLFVFFLVPARAEEGALSAAAGSIEDLLKAGKLTDAEALAARSAKTLAADPSALSAADTAS